MSWKYYDNSRENYEKYIAEEKIKEQIREEKIRKYRLYKEIYLDSFTLPHTDGSVTIYQISPLPPRKTIRCHHVLRGIRVGEGKEYEYYYDKFNKKIMFPEKQYVTSITNWEKVWNCCGNPDISYNKKCKGPLRRGLLYCDDNTMYAVVVDKKITCGKFMLVGLKNGNFENKN